MTDFELLKAKVDQHEKSIQELSMVVKKVANSVQDVVGVQNEIAKQVMYLTEAITTLQEVLMGPKPEYRFFNNDEWEN